MFLVSISATSQRSKRAAETFVVYLEVLEE